MLSAIPRKYRHLVTKVALCLLLCILLVQLLPSNDHSGVKEGKSDDDHFTFVDFEEEGEELKKLEELEKIERIGGNIDELFPIKHKINGKNKDKAADNEEEEELQPAEDGIIHDKVLAPSSFRGEDGEDLIQVEDEDKKEEVVEPPIPPVEEDNASYYTEEELKPLFTKPPNNQDEEGNLLPGEMGNRGGCLATKRGRLG